MAVEWRKLYVGSKDSVIVYSGTPSAIYAFNKFMHSTNLCIQQIYAFNKYVLGAVAKYF